ALLSIPYPFTSGTYTDVALSFVRTNNLFGTTQGGRDEAQNILLVITDGQSYFPTLTISEAQKLKDAGVSIVTIGVGLTVYEEINAMASQLDYVFTINSFDLLDIIQNSLLNTTCDISNGAVNPRTQITQTLLTETKMTTIHSSESEMSPPKSTLLETASSTLSSTDISSTTLSDKEPVSADIIILLDSSASLGLENWLKMIKFAADFVESFDVGPDGAQFGALTFSNRPELLFRLNSYPNRTPVIEKILSTPYVPTYTRNQGLNQGLASIRSWFLFEPSSGGRPEAPDIVIVIMNGTSRYPAEASYEAGLLKENGINIVAVGVGLDSAAELMNIANDKESVISVNGFDQLDDIKFNLMSEVLDIVSMTTSTYMTNTTVSNFLTTELAGTTSVSIASSTTSITTTASTLSTLNTLPSMSTIEESTEANLQTTLSQVTTNMIPTTYASTSAFLESSTTSVSTTSSTTTTTTTVPTIKTTTSVPTISTSTLPITSTTKASTEANLPTTLSQTTSNTTTTTHASTSAFLESSTISASSASSTMTTTTIVPTIKTTPVPTVSTTITVPNTSTTTVSTEATTKTTPSTNSSTSDILQSITTSASTATSTTTTYVPTINTTTTVTTVTTTTKLPSTSTTSASTEATTKTTPSTHASTSFLESSTTSASTVSSTTNITTSVPTVSKTTVPNTSTTSASTEATTKTTPSTHASTSAILESSTTSASTASKTMTTTSVTTINTTTSVTTVSTTTKLPSTSTTSASTEATTKTTSTNAITSAILESSNTSASTETNTMPTISVPTVNTTTSIPAVSTTSTLPSTSTTKVNTEEHLPTTLSQASTNTTPSTHASTSAILESSTKSASTASSTMTTTTTVPTINTTTFVTTVSTTTTLPNTSTTSAITEATTKTTPSTHASTSAILESSTTSASKASNTTTTITSVPTVNTTTSDPTIRTSTKESTEAKIPTTLSQASSNTTPSTHASTSAILETSTSAFTASSALTKTTSVSITSTTLSSATSISPRTTTVQLATSTETLVTNGAISTSSAPANVSFVSNGFTNQTTNASTTRATTRDVSTSQSITTLHVTETTSTTQASTQASSTLASATSISPRTTTVQLATSTGTLVTNESISTSSAPANISFEDTPAPLPGDVVVSCGNSSKADIIFLLDASSSVTEPNWKKIVKFSSDLVLNFTFGSDSNLFGAVIFNSQATKKFDLNTYHNKTAVSNALLAIPYPFTSGTNTASALSFILTNNTFGTSSGGRDDAQNILIVITDGQSSNPNQTIIAAQNLKDAGISIVTIGIGLADLHEITAMASQHDFVFNISNFDVLSIINKDLLQITCGISNGFTNQTTNASTTRATTRDVSTSQSITTLHVTETTSTTQASTQASSTLASATSISPRTTTVQLATSTGTLVTNESISTSSAPANISFEDTPAPLPGDVVVSCGNSSKADIIFLLDASSSVTEPNWKKIVKFSSDLVLNFTFGSDSNLFGAVIFNSQATKKFDLNTYHNKTAVSNALLAIPYPFTSGTNTASALSFILTNNTFGTSSGGRDDAQNILIVITDGQSSNPNQTIIAAQNLKDAGISIVTIGIGLADLHEITAMASQHDFVFNISNFDVLSIINKDLLQITCGISNGFTNQTTNASTTRATTRDVSTSQSITTLHVTETTSTTQASTQASSTLASATSISPRTTTVQLATSTGTLVTNESISTSSAPANISFEDTPAPLPGDVVVSCGNSSKADIIFLLDASSSVTEPNWKKIVKFSSNLVLNFTFGSDSNLFGAVIFNSQATKKFDLNTYHNKTAVSNALLAIPYPFTSGTNTASALSFILTNNTFGTSSGGRDDAQNILIVITDGQSSNPNQTIIAAQNLKDAGISIVTIGIGLADLHEITAMASQHDFVFNISNFDVLSIINKDLLQITCGISNGFTNQTTNASTTRATTRDVSTSQSITTLHVTETTSTTQASTQASSTLASATSISPRTTTVQLATSTGTLVTNESISTSSAPANISFEDTPAPLPGDVVVSCGNSSKADIIFLLDASSSVTEPNWKKIVKFSSDLVLNFTFGSDSNLFGAVIFNSQATKKFDLNTYHNKTAVSNALLAIPYPFTSGTNTASALSFILTNNTFGTSSGGRDDAQNILIVITDGQSSNPNQTIIAAQNLKDAGISIVTIGIGLADLHEITAMASQHDFVFNISNFDVLSIINKDLLQITCGISNGFTNQTTNASTTRATTRDVSTSQSITTLHVTETTSTTQASTQASSTLASATSISPRTTTVQLATSTGTLVTNESISTSSAPANISFEDTPAPLPGDVVVSCGNSSKADIIFLLDASSSVTEPNWKKIVKFSSDLVLNFTFGSDSNLFGAVIFNSQATKKFDLNTYHNKTAVSNALLAIPYPFTSGTNTASALSFILTNNTFGTSSGGRDDAQNILIVITDGQSSNPNQTIIAAQNLKDAGISIVTIGIGLADLHEITAMASQHDFVFNISNFDVLSIINKDLLQITCGISNGFTNQTTNASTTRATTRDVSTSQSITTLHVTETTSTTQASTQASSTLASATSISPRTTTVQLATSTGTLVTNESISTSSAPANISFEDTPAPLPGDVVVSCGNSSKADIIFLLDASSSVTEPNWKKIVKFSSDLVLNFTFGSDSNLFGAVIFNSQATKKFDLNTYHNKTAVSNALLAIPYPFTSGTNTASALSFILTNNTFGTSSGGRDDAQNILIVITDGQSSNPNQTIIAAQNLKDAGISIVTIGIGLADLHEITAMASQHDFVFNISNFDVLSIINKDLLQITCGISNGFTNQTTNASTTRATTRDVSTSQSITTLHVTETTSTTQASTQASSTLASATSISPRTTTVQLATSTGTLVTNESISTSSAPANISFEDTPAPLPGDVVVSCGNSSKADIIFLLDASSSVTEPNWKKIVKFSSDLVLNFTFGSDSNLFGAVIFNSQATKKFDLNTYHNKTAVANALLAIPYPFTSGTNTASALSFILTNNTFGTSSGGRDDAQNILIVITDGQSSNPNQTIIAAQNLKDAGISIVTIGIGLADLHEITAMASQHDFVFNISNFDVLSIINKDLLQITCGISNGFTNQTTNASTTRATTRDVSTSQSITTLHVTETTSTTQASTQASSTLASATSISPRTTTVQLATSTGTLVTNESISTSSAPANISFEDTPAPLPGDVVVSCGNSSKADIIFLLDASSSVTEPNWKKIVKFSSDLVLNFTFGSDSNLFGAVIFNSQATKKFDLNTYHNKTAVSNALLAIPYPFTSGTNTASALSFILTNNTFGTSSGGRDDAQNILIVITDGQSSNPNQTIIAAQNLKDAGISIVTIGIGLADLHEITAMASQHDFVFNISNFDVLSIINKDLLQITCGISNGFTNQTTNASTTRATTRDVSTSQSITTLHVTETTSTTQASTQASSTLASATSISPRTTTVQLATSTGTLVTNESISTSSAPANISFEDTPAPLPGDVVVSCGNSSKADIIFLLDASSSVTEPNWKKIVKFSSDLVLNFTFGSDSNLFGAVIFNSQATKKFDLNTYHNKTAVSNALLAIPYPFTSGTNTASALSFILTNNTFGTSSGGRDDAQNILIVITDGQSSNPNQTIIAAQNLKDAGISIVTIGIGLADLHEITAMASQHDFVFNISNFDVLSIINKDLLQITCGISNGFTNQTTNASTTRATTRDVSTSQSITTLHVTETTSTTQASTQASSTLASATSISPRTTTVQLATSTGTLVTNESISTSSAPANISFEDTPAPLPGDVVVSCGNSSKADIIFLLDASSSVTEPNWKKIVKFSSDLVLNFTFGSDSNLFGAVIFNSQATKKFDLNTYHNKTAVSNALLAIPYPFTSGTNTASALSFILTNNTFGTSSGGRDDAQNILIVITDGQSSNPNQTIIAAQNLKDAGISIVTIGIGLADLHEITAMASQHDFVFNISNFDVLSIINKDLLQITCGISNGFTNQTTNASTTRATTRDVSTSQSITTLHVTETTSTTQASTQASSTLASATSISPRTTTVQLATSTGTLVTNESISTSSAPANISFEDTPAPLPGDVVVSCGNSSKADIIFLLDASSSVTEPNWKKIVKFSSDLVLNFTFGSDSNLFGAVIFNSQATKKFDLNTYHNKTAVSNALLAIPYPFTSGTNTASALSFILTNNTFGTSSGGRDDAQNILIVITDGQSSNPNQTIIAAQNLKDAGISIVTIGIGLADLHEITAMASQHDFVFNISNFDVLSIINKDLLQITCGISNGFTNQTTNASTTRATTRDVSTSQSITTLHVTETTSTTQASTQASSTLASATSISPRTTTVQLATSTGTLVTNESISTSSAPANISFEDTPAPLPGDVVVSCGNSSKADIIFLLDASSSVTEPNWKKIVKFSSDLVLNFTFGSDSNLFGAVIFNSQATKKFDLNTYHNKTAVANALLAIPYPFTSGTNTASALSFILTNNTFGTSSGGRDDAQNILIVITDGQSSNPNQTIIAAQNLKDAGISIVTIGIGLADLHEITAMASQHDFVFNISNFDVLSIINKDLLQITCGISNGFTNQTTNASTTRATTRDVSTSQSITTLHVTETTSTTQASTQASSSLASATSISPRTTTVQLATSTGTLVTNESISTSSAPANISFEDTPAPLPGDVVVSCGNSSKADIIFLLDASSSVTEPNWKKIVKFSSDLVLNFTFGSDSNLFGAVIFNSQATKKFDLNTYHNKTAVSNALLAIPYPFTSGTNTASALSFILTNNTFGTSSGGRDDAQNILIVITDGQSSNPNQTIIAAQNLKDAGISIVTIGIGLADLHEITAMASQHDFVFNISNFDVLSIINKDLLQITCGISNGFTNQTTNASTTRATTRDVSTSQSITTLHVTETTSTTQASTQASSTLASATSISPRTTTVQLATSTGTLVTNESISTSSAPANISFEDTPAPLPGDVVVSCGNSSKADIIFLLDASSSVTEPNWKKIVKFSSDLVLNFTFGSDSNLFGAVIFNSQATKKFDLNTYHNKTAVSNALLAIPYPFTSGTNTASALSFILTNNTFGTSSGGRDDAQNILIVITDGQSSNPNQTIIAAQNLKDAGISIVTIGIGLADLHEITAMASQHDFVFNISNFDVLSIINKDLLQITCGISNGFTNQTTNASTTRATTRDVSTSQSITTLHVTETTSTTQASTQASSTLASATSISPRTTTVQLATSTGTLVTNESISTSSAPANISFEDTPAPLPGDVVVSCGNSSKADIIFLLDASSSVTEPNWKKIVKFSSDLVLNFTFGSDSNLFGAVIFNSQATKKFDLNTYHNKTAVSNALLAIPYPFTSGTNTASALSFILTNNTFGTSSGGRDDAQNILIVITDGQSSNPNQTIIAAQNLKDAGISIVTIGIGLADLHEITAMASQHDFVFNISNFDVLSIINKDLLQITCGISNGFTNQTTNASTTRATTRDVSTSQSITTLHVTETTSTTQASTQASSTLASATSISPRTTTVQLATSTGTLVTNESISTSSAPANISFEDTPAPLPGDVVVSCGNSSKADIIFLLDASSSVTEPNWKKIVKFSSDLVLNFTFGSDSNLFGAVIFNSQATKKFDLNTYHNKTAVANALLAIPYPFTSGTNTASALSFILTNNTFGTSSGGRDDAQNILIVITDGQSSNPNQTIIAAQNLKDAGISIVTIGIGLADLHEITAMASQHDFVFNISNFDILSIINEDLLQITCHISNSTTNLSTSDLTG
ncbi:serine-rich adhesin for platelets, partial [Biomphalaria glabrata]